MTLRGRFSWACRNRAQTVVFRTSNNRLIGALGLRGYFGTAGVLCRRCRLTFAHLTLQGMIRSTTKVNPAETTCYAVQCSNRTKIRFLGGLGATGAAMSHPRDNVETRCAWKPAAVECVGGSRLPEGRCTSSVALKRAVLGEPAAVECVGGLAYLKAVNFIRRRTPAGRDFLACKEQDG